LRKPSQGAPALPEGAIAVYVMFLRQVKPRLARQ
jgi:hypothetical protein